MNSIAYPTNTGILIRAFDGKAALLWLVFGVFFGVAAGVFGASAIPVEVFSIASGFGIPMYLLVIVVSGFSLLGRLPGRVGELARGDFENFERGAQSKAIRAGSALLGLALLGGTYVAVTGSHVGAVLCIYAGWFSVTVYFCWGCLAILAYKHYNKPPKQGSYGVVRES
jgi:hypothetical protein